MPRKGMFKRIFIWYQKGKFSVRVMKAWLAARLRGEQLTVILRMSGLGDVLWCAPLARQIKELNPRASVLLMAYRPFQELVKPERCAGFDYVAGMYPLTDPPSRLIKFLAKRDVKILRPLCWNEQGIAGEEIHLLTEFQKSLGLPHVLSQPYISITEREKTKALRQFDIRRDQFAIILHTGRTWAVRELEEQVWQELVDRINREMDCRILHICYPRKEITGTTSPFSLRGVENIPLNHTLPEIAALISVCQLFIGIDSGLMHIAGTVKTPVIGIFGSTKPELRLPVEGKALGISQKQPCSYCQHYSPLQHWRTSCPHGIKCLKELSAEYIYTRLRPFLTELKINFKSR